jgi:hypothetical protein
MSEVLLGTCGRSYAEWESIFYPEKQAKLKQYSSIFPTTEIDMSVLRVVDKLSRQGFEKTLLDVDHQGFFKY